MKLKIFLILCVIVVLPSELDAGMTISIRGCSFQTEKNFISKIFRLAWDRVNQRENAIEQEEEEEEAASAAAIEEETTEEVEAIEEETTEEVEAIEEETTETDWASQSYVTDCQITFLALNKVKYTMDNFDKITCGAQNLPADEMCRRIHFLYGKPFEGELSANMVNCHCRCKVNCELRDKDGILVSNKEQKYLTARYDENNMRQYFLFQQHTRNAPVYLRHTITLRKSDE